jgi:hypothetical protein
LPEDWLVGWWHDQEVGDRVVGPFMMRMKGEKKTGFRKFPFLSLLMLEPW